MEGATTADVVAAWAAEFADYVAGDSVGYVSCFVGEHAVDVWVVVAYALRVPKSTRGDCVVLEETSGKLYDVRLPIRARCMRHVCCVLKVSSCRVPDIG